MPSSTISIGYFKDTWLQLATNPHSLYFRIFPRRLAVIKTNDATWPQYGEIQGQVDPYHLGVHKLCSSLGTSLKAWTPRPALDLNCWTDKTDHKKHHCFRNCFIRTLGAIFVKHFPSQSLSWTRNQFLEPMIQKQTLTIMEKCLFMEYYLKQNCSNLSSKCQAGKNKKIPNTQPPLF